MGRKDDLGGRASKAHGLGTTRGVAHDVAKKLVIVDQLADDGVVLLGFYRVKRNTNKNKNEQCVEVFHGIKFLR